MAKKKKKVTKIAAVSRPPIKGDYLIVEGAKRMEFVKVRSADKDTIIAVKEQSLIEGKRVKAEYAPEQIVLNMGPKTRFGTVYGNKIEPLLAQFEVDDWGEVHVYRRLEKGEKSLIVKAMGRVFKEMKKRKLDHVFPVTTEVRTKHGRWAGHYHISDKYEDSPHNHMICLHPKEIDAEIVSLLRHELGHAVWYLSVPDKVKMKWVSMFVKSVERMTAKREVLKELLEELETGRDLPLLRAGLKEEAEAEEGKSFHKIDVLDECLDYIKSTFHLDKEGLDIVINNSKSLERYWPKNPMDLSSVKENPAVMTEYGMTSVIEFFAEAFRLYMEGKAAKSVKKLMDKTLSRLRR